MINFNNLFKQHMVMIVEFDINFIIIAALGCFGDDYGFGLKLVCNQID